MDINHTELDLSPESIPLRRSVWLIFFSAAAVLLLILGKNPLLGSEGGSAESIRLLTGEDNCPARHLYESLGYTAEDEVLYTK